MAATLGMIGKAGELESKMVVPGALRRSLAILKGSHAVALYGGCMVL